MEQAGWSLEGCHGIDNLAGQGLCKKGHFHAHGNGNLVGVATKILQGTGSATLNYGNCWNSGMANVYLNDVKIAGASKSTINQEVRFNFTHGDKLQVPQDRFMFKTIV